MNILNAISNEEQQSLEKINIKLLDKDYSISELKEITQNIYKDGYMNIETTYGEAEEYKKLYERFSVLSKIDIEKVKKYSKKEFEDDYYVTTVLMHGVIWNSPHRINEARKRNGKKLLNEDEFERLKKIQKENSKKFENYIEYLENKYGKDLEATAKYYSTIIK